MSARALGEFLSGMGHAAPRVGAFLDTLSPGDAAKLMAAVEAGDNRPLLKAFADQTWTTTPARSARSLPSEAQARIPLEERLASEPKIRAGVEDAGMSTAGMNNQQMLEAYAEAFRNAGARRGRPKSTEDSIREMVRPPADQVAAESIASQFDRAIGGDVPTRQMELPMGDEPTGLVPFGVRGPGVPVGGPAAAAADSRRLEAMVQGLPAAEAPPIRLADDTALQDFIGQPVRGDDFIPDAPPFSRPEFHARNLAAGINGKEAAATAAGAIGAGAGAYWMLHNGRELRNKAAEAGVPEAMRDPLGTQAARDPLSLFSQDGPAVESGGEADLAAETSPPPAVAAAAETPEPTVVQAPQDYSLQARALINRLNDMRRAAGGEVPEAPVMMKEINRLIAMGNEQRRTPATFTPGDHASQMYKQAQILIDQVNQMYRQGMTPNSPQVQRVMAQVRQLQSQGDAIRNRRAE